MQTTPPETDDRAPRRDFLEELHTEVQATLERSPETEPSPRRLHPRIDTQAVDFEPLFPGKALPTLLDYVRLLKTMGQGDPLKAVASVGLEVAGWTAEATAWGQVLTGRLELGLRFGELMTAPWE